MKKITLILATLFMTATMAMAQGGPRGGQKGAQRNSTPEQRAERMTDRMTKEYSLSDKQKTALYAVNLDMAQKAPQRMAPARGERGKSHKAMCQGCACENCQKCTGCKAGEKAKCAKADKTCKVADGTKVAGNKAKSVDKPSKEEREKRMAEMKKNREEYDAQIKKIFTKKQYEAYTQKQAERQQRAGERRDRPQA